MKPTARSSCSPREDMETDCLDQLEDLELELDVWNNWDFVRPVVVAPLSGKEEEATVRRDGGGGETHRRMVEVEDEELFYEKLRDFHQSDGHQRGLICNTGDEALDLYALYKVVTSEGGLAQVIKNRRWDDVTSALKWTTRVSFPLLLSYLDLLFHFEQMYFSRAGEVAALPGLHMTSNLMVKTSTDQLGSTGVSSAVTKKCRKSDLSSSKVGPCAHIGNIVTGAIKNKFESGYIVTVTVGGEKLSGVLYHAEECVAEQLVIVPVLVGCLGTDFEHDHPVRLEIRMSSSKSKSRGVSKRRPVKKDVDMPLGLRSSYQFFMKEELHRRKKLKQDLNNKNVYKMAINAWKCLPKSERLPFVEKSRKDRERYDREMDAYNERHSREKNIKLEPEQQQYPHGSDGL